MKAMKFKEFIEYLIDDFSSEQSLFSYHNKGEIKTVNKKSFLQTMGAFLESLQTFQSKEVVLISHSKLEFLAPAFFACLCLDFKPAFVAYPSNKVSAKDFEEKLAEILNTFPIAAILTENELRESYANFEGLKILEIEDCLRQKKSINYGGPELSKLPHEPMFIQFSSGSTGIPKAMEFPFCAVSRHCEELADAVRLDKSSDSIISWLPLYHDMGLIACTLFPLINKIPFHMISPFEWVQSVQILLEDAQKLGSTHTWMPNFAFELLAQRCGESKVDLSGFKMIASCAEPVQVATMKNFYSAFKNKGLKPDVLAVTWAMAENTFAMTHRFYDMDTDDWFVSVERDKLRKGLIEQSKTGVDSQEIPSCGFPVANTKVLAQTEAVCDLRIQSPSTLKSYLGRTDRILDDRNYFNTKDRGFEFNGEIFVCGRSSDLIIVRGVNIYPQNIEKIMDSIEGLIPGRNVCLAQDDGEGSKELILLAEVRHDSFFYGLEQMISKKVQNYLGFLPSRVELLPRNWLRKTSSGKISRLPNLEKYQQYLSRNILVFGCSHVYSFNESDELYNQDSTAKNVFLKQLAVVSAQNIGLDHRMEEMLKNLGSLQTGDLVVFFIGEQDIRNLIPFLKRTEAITWESAVSRVIQIHNDWIGRVKESYPELEFIWLLPPPPGKGLTPHPRFLAMQEMSNELYYHYQADQSQRREIASLYRETMKSSLAIQVVDYWDEICEEGLLIKKSYERDISHLCKVRSVLQKAITRETGALFDDLKTPPRHKKVTLVMENVGHEIHNLLEEVAKRQLESEPRPLDVLDSMNTVRFLSTLQERYEVELPDNWTRLDEFHSFSSLCDWVMKHRQAQNPFDIST